MKLSIVILNYKSWEDLDRCLAEIMKHEPSHPFEIIVVDNFSEMPTQEHGFLQKWKTKAKYIASKINGGFSAGNELGIAVAQGEYIAIMNPDIEVREKSLDTAIAYMDAHKHVGILGGQLRYDDHTIQDSYRVFPKLLDQIIKRVSFLRKNKTLRKRVADYLMWHKDPNLIEPVDWVVGAFMVIRKKAYDEVGGFDKRYFLFMEDTDLCRLMWEKGWQVIYHPEVKALHKQSRLSGGGIIDFFKKKTMRIHFISALKYFWKHKFKKHPRGKN